MSRSTRSLGFFVPLFLTLAVSAAGCGSVSPEETVRGDYVISGAAYCEVMEPGQPLDVAGLDGEVAVIATGGGTYVDGCLSLVQVNTEICSGCALDTCELCLVPPTAAGRWALSERYPDSVGLTSCHITDPRGGSSSDLLIAGQSITGTLESTPTGVHLDFSFPGTIRTGISGAARSAAVHCVVNAIPAP